MWKQTLTLYCIQLLFLAAITSPANAETYYVAPSGDDAGPGTEAMPWKGLRKAAGAVKPGDTVRIKAGSYSVAPTWTLNRAGTAEKPITFQAHGDGEVRISGAATLPADGWKQVKDGIYSTELAERVLCVFAKDLPLHEPGDRAKISSVETMIPNSFFKSATTLYVWLEDGSDPKNTVIRAARDHVISLRECHYTILDGLTVEYGFNGIKDQGETTHHITIRNCVIRSISSQGIQPVAKNCVIEKNTFQKIGTNKYQHGIYGSQPGTIIRHNVFEEISGAGIHQYNQTKPAGGGCEFYGNTFRKPRKMTVRSGPAGGSYYLDIIAWGEGSNLIYNNVFFGEGKRGGISLNSPNNQVYHNTFVQPTWGIGFHDRKPGNKVMNNLVTEPVRTFLAWPEDSLPQTLDHNLYHSTAKSPRWEHNGTVHRTFEAYQKAAGETHSRSADPLLVGAADARLRAGSPAIDAGATLKEVPKDFDGIARSQGAAPDPGAYEHKAGGAP